MKPVPAVASVLRPSTSMSESTVTGPTDVCRPLPASAYTIIGRMEAYKPMTGGRPANSA